jgi:hypothetical protein
MSAETSTRSLLASTQTATSRPSEPSPRPAIRLKSDLVEIRSVASVMSRDEGARHTGSPFRSPPAESERLDRCPAHEDTEERKRTPSWNRYHSAEAFRSQDRNPAGFGSLDALSRARAAHRETPQVDAAAPRHTQVTVETPPRALEGRSIARAVISRFAAAIASRRPRPAARSPRCRSPSFAPARPSRDGKTLRKHVVSASARLGRLATRRRCAPTAPRRSRRPERCPHRSPLRRRGATTRGRKGARAAARSSHTGGSSRSAANPAGELVGARVRTDPTPSPKIGAAPKRTEPKTGSAKTGELRPTRERESTRPRNGQLPGSTEGGGSGAPFGDTGLGTRFGENGLGRTVKGEQRNREACPHQNRAPKELTSEAHWNVEKSPDCMLTAHTCAL